MLTAPDVYFATPKKARHFWNRTAAHEALAAASNGAESDSGLAYRLAVKVACRLVRERHV